MKLLLSLCLFSAIAHAQLVTNPQAIPKGTKPPVVFLNGYEASCAGIDFAGTFATADQTLQRNGEVSLFFNNCAVPGDKPTIETLGAAFGTFLNSLRYTDGQPVTQVDVVAHSMGGLIVRSYLSGKQPGDAVFNPPASTPIRKLVFLATPHFGTDVTLLTPLQDNQTREITVGSRFLYDLATWNQGTEDFRGLDVLSVIGDAGNGQTKPAGFDDSTVTLTSGSIQTWVLDRTRIIHACHITGGLIAQFNLCTAGAPGIAEIKSDTQDTARILVSFLNGTDDWKSVGQAPADNSFLKDNAGVLAAWRNAQDQFYNLDSATYLAPDGTSRVLTVYSNNLAYKELVPVQNQTITLKSGTQTLSGKGNLQPGQTNVFTYKDGPSINRVFPAASAVFPLQLAPGMFVSIYGGQLAEALVAASGLPFPQKLGTTEVLVGGTPVGLQVVSATQINAVLPTGVSGLQPLTVRNAAGAATVNIYIAPSLPTLFTTDQTGKGNVAALNAVTAQVVNPAHPLKAGDYVSLFLTGLGDTNSQGGLDYAKTQPSVFVGGVACPVSYAGRAPGFVGLDQVNCQIPTGLRSDPATSVVVTSGGRVGNQGTLPIQ